jgi:hypothetical protein
MPTTWEDAAYDQYLAEFDDEVRPDEIIEDFALGRLRSYYVANPLVAEPAIGLLVEAKTLLGCKYPRAALVLAAASAEIAVKSVLLHPVV